MRNMTKQIEARKTHLHTWEHRITFAYVVITTVGLCLIERLLLGLSSMAAREEWGELLDICFLSLKMILKATIPQMKTSLFEKYVKALQPLSNRFYKRV